jgi:hypothetical protein
MDELFENLKRLEFKAFKIKILYAFEEIENWIEGLGIEMAVIDAISRDIQDL